MQAFNGVSGERSEVSQIPDGQSNVFFAGEKYLDPDLYYTGSDGADNDTCLEGNDWDVNRWVMTGFPPMRDTQWRERLLSPVLAARTPRACNSSSAMVTCK